MKKNILNTHVIHKMVSLKLYIEVDLNTEVYLKNKCCVMF